MTRVRPRTPALLRIVLALLLCSSSGWAWAQAPAGTDSRPVLSVPAAHPVEGPVRAGTERIEMLAIDTLFYVENEGLTRIHVDLNGHRFKMVSDPAEVQRSVNAFLMPEYGTITVNVAALVEPGVPNFVEFMSQGPEGTKAEVVLSPVPVIGQTVAYAIEALQPLPAQFRLSHNHPNPFRDRTTISYTISDTRINGVDVHLAVYDALGREVAVLVNDRRFPGRYTVTWTPPSRAATGIYYARLIAGGSQATIPMVHIR